MASVNFLYRSAKPKGFVTARLLFSYNQENFVYAVNTQLEVEKEYWTKYHKKTKPKDITIVNRQLEINSELNRIENHIINAFRTINPLDINKDWLQTTIDSYYNPTNVSSEIPKHLLGYIDYYVEEKRNEVTESTLKKCGVNKNLLLRYEKHIKQTLLIKDVNLDFKSKFEKYCIKEQYAPNTIARAIRFFKTICRHAKLKGIEVSNDLDAVTTKYVKSEHVYLTFEELDIIKNLDKDVLSDRLNNVRDWLLISCYTGQRVSDFMRFTKDMIRYEQGKPLLEFTQKKTNQIMTIPVHPIVLAVLEKRNGEFPVKLSEQKYNAYIKEVAGLAGLDTVIYGSKKEQISEGKYRKVTGNFKKFELVSSHIGRRSFATNFYGTMPTTMIKNITGHKTEAMLLTYIGKSNKDLALDTFKYFG
jgi:hypothetical protein